VCKQPVKTSTNGVLIRKVFRDLAQMELQIPSFINNYNHFINSVDLTNQFQEVYKLHRITLCTWWPLFYWLINVIYMNAYWLYILHTTEHDPKVRLLSHLQFCIELYYKLLQNSTTVQQIHLQITLPG
jgi:hypothetical protein